MTSTINVDHLPADLRALQRWLIWRTELRDGKPTKVPYTPTLPAFRRRASVDDASTWGSFDAALGCYRSACEQGGSGTDGPYGIGIVLGDGLAGIDLDKCIDPNGNVKPWAMDVVIEIDSYTEFSPSSTGLHVLARGSLPPGRRRKGKIEMYAEGRYFTITGKRFLDELSAIEERTDALAALHQRVFGAAAPAPNGREQAPAPPLDLDDEQLLERAFAARNGDKFRRLWNGDTSDYDGDDSAADLALCSLLAFWAGRDAGRMDRLFRRSGLMRAKWDARRGDATYGRQTVATAVESCRETYSPPQPARPSSPTEPSSRIGISSPGKTSDLPNNGERNAEPKSDQGGREREARAPAPKPFTPPEHWRWYDLANLDEWEVEPFEPIVDGLIARGNLVLEVAATQTGKSLLGGYEARMLVTGGKLFGRYAVTPVDRVLYIVLEDPARRFHGRLLDMARGFGPLAARRCVFLVAPGFRIDDDAMFLWLGETVRAYGEGHTVVMLDTYQRATPGIASFDDEKQSLILHRLAGLTRSLDITLIVKDHFRKTASTGRQRGEMTIDDIKGTGGKAQNADCVILMERTPDRKQIKFQAFSKDFDDPVRILLNVAPKDSTEPKFSYAGDLERLGSASREKGAENRDRVLKAMKPNEWYSSTELAKELGMAERTVRGHLSQLAKDGQIADNDAKGKARRYWVVGKTSTHPISGHPESGKANPASDNGLVAGTVTDYDDPT